MHKSASAGAGAGAIIKNWSVVRKCGVIRSIYNAAYLALAFNAQTASAAVIGDDDRQQWPPVIGCDGRISSCCRCSCDGGISGCCRSAQLFATANIAFNTIATYAMVMMGVTYADGIKGCSELESLASITTIIITTTVTYWINTTCSK